MNIRDMSWLAVLAVTFLVASPVFAQNSDKPAAPLSEQRVALVIGNSSYKIAPLKNPVNDKRAMSKTLSTMGFDVTALEETSLVEMRRAIGEFGRKLAKGGVGLFYFSGNCVTTAGRSLILPIDLDANSASGVMASSVDLSEILRAMGSAKNKMNFLVLDCCLDDPFSTKATPALPELPPETYVAFATTPGHTASDGSGDHGLYTEHLLAALDTPGLSVEQVFKQVRVQVTQASKLQQVPWENSSITGEFYFRPPGEKSQVAMQAPGQQAAISSIHFGNYHALVIGNNNYHSMPKLKTAVNDARSVAQLLEKAYGFKVKLLIDATRGQMLDAFDDLRKNLSRQDNLLIYYAGHGYLDDDSDRGFWLPVEADGNRRANWLSNSDLSDTVRAVRAKHVLVVADSCYAGTLTRGVATSMTALDDFSRLAQKRARTALMSGGLEPVEDAGGGGHSVFAKAFLDALNANNGVVDMSQVFSSMRRQVILTAQQTPQYSDIRQTGHEGGDFLFVRRDR